MQREVIERVHSGVEGTFESLRQNYWFRGMKLAPGLRPPALGGRWHIDGLQLPLSNGCDHLLVATDVAKAFERRNISCSNKTGDGYHSQIWEPAGDHHRQGPSVSEYDVRDCM